MRKRDNQISEFSRVTVRVNKRYASQQTSSDVDASLIYNINSQKKLLKQVANDLHIKTNDEFYNIISKQVIRYRSLFLIPELRTPKQRPQHIAQPLPTPLLHALYS
jgi:hypothetical protein